MNRIKFFIIYSIGFIFIMEIVVLFYSISVTDQLQEYNEDIISTNNESSITISLVGDSIAAGVGASSLNSSLGNRIVDYFSANYSVTLNNSATGGNKMEDIKIYGKSVNITIAIIGSNDVLQFTPLKKFKTHSERVISNISHTSNKAVLVGPGRIHDVPAIPFFIQPIYLFSGDMYADILENVSSQYSNVVYVNPLKDNKVNEEFDDVELEAKDNFHPNDKGHDYWFNLIKLGLEKE